MQAHRQRGLMAGIQVGRNTLTRGISLVVGFVNGALALNSSWGLLVWLCLAVTRHVVQAFKGGPRAIQGGAWTLLLCFRRAEGGESGVGI